MNWFKKIISGRQKVVKNRPPTSQKPKRIIEIANSYGHYDSSPLLVEKSPDLEKIFNNPDPPVIQKPSNSNREYWSKASASERYMTALIGYLQHPEPEVRRAVMTFASKNQSMRVSQVLVDRLGGDPDPSVQIAAAKTIWERERKSNCEFTVDCLKDEITYGTERSLVGPTRARKAFQLLLKYAPDQKAKDSLQKSINK